MYSSFGTDDIYLGMFEKCPPATEDTDIENFVDTSAKVHDEKSRRFRNRLKNTHLGKRKGKQKTAGDQSHPETNPKLTLPPCPLCTGSYGRTDMEDIGLDYESVGKQYEIVLSGPLGFLEHFEEIVESQKKSPEEEELERAIEKCGEFGRCFVYLKKQFRKFMF